MYTTNANTWNQILWLAEPGTHGKLWTQQVILSEGIVLQILHNFEDSIYSRLRLKCDGTSTETTFSLLAKWTSTSKSAGASVQSTPGSWGVRISGSNAGYTKFRGSVKSTGYPLYSPVSPSPPLPCITVCHHISTGFYLMTWTSICKFWTRMQHVRKSCYIGINNSKDRKHKTPHLRQNHVKFLLQDPLTVTITPLF
jgi:hypothetical protein